MSRFFIDEKDIQGNKIYIRGEDVNHIKNVLRLKIGESIILCDGKGMDYTAGIEKFEPDYVLTGISASNYNETEPPIEVVLFQGIPKSDKMDFIIQKAIELGVNRIVPVMTERAVVRIEDKRDAEKKVCRWQRIALEAAKQSNRGIIPRVEYPVRYREALTLSDKSDLSLIPYEKEFKNSLKKYISQADADIKKVSLFIGPEGGFSEKEIEDAVQKGIKPVTLGPRVLRTETAGISVISILMYELGDINFWK
ncbi:MAG: 16S rRNA (uracil(1498)-N(3))-methyltransferase [Clostridiales bacterium]|nr:16S rRNA (uracil(1498)-N(3))-methyltransferase [Eubacteriales bacterium]MDH7565493.1 16S rRNA (uracil(1498)-N(3))-methyltransferase [Clostridiales bacterium]